MTFCHKSALALCLLVNWGSTIAQAHSSHQHEAHVHGVAELLIVLEGQQLDIELVSPAVNLLGFEHRANTPEERKTIKSANRTFANAGNVFQLNAQACQLKEYQQNFDSIIDTTSDSADHDSHGHRKKHSNIKVLYRYTCKQKTKLSTIKTSIFSKFPKLEQLEVQWIVNGRQGAAILDNSQRLLNFR